MSIYVTQVKGAPQDMSKPRKRQAMFRYIQQLYLQNDRQKGVLIITKPSFAEWLRMKDDLPENIIITECKDVATATAKWKSYENDLSVHFVFVF